MRTLFVFLSFCVGVHGALAQGVWCSTVVEQRASGYRYVGFALNGTPTTEQSRDGLASVARMGAVIVDSDKRHVERVTGKLSLSRHTAAGNAPNIFDLTIVRPTEALSLGASLGDLGDVSRVGSAGVLGSSLRTSFWAGRAKYKGAPEQYLSSEITYSYSTDTEHIEHICRMCSPKMGTCPNHEDPAVLQKEAQKLNATLVEPKLF
jgi:hypothetical protein